MPAKFTRTEVILVEPSLAAHFEGGRAAIPILGGLRGGGKWFLGPGRKGEADALANLGSPVDSDEFESGIVVQLMSSVVEEGHTEVNSTSLTWDWKNKYIDYLKKGKLPSDPKESRALRAKAARFSLVEEKLFRRSYFGPLVRCLGPGKTDDAMRKVHEGTCGNHSGAKSLV
uniref:Uncharacterized protein LOC104235624 n=1 Tax=Nicotiana sylvestris TaxID=4096 RepID=A0A1U7XA47_NICSY|nr:PREDICTED: uncharacterized protein LOC104235624 [Nicotiana sylvestris]